VRHVCSLLKTAAEYLKELVEARSLLCYFAVHALGIPAVEPAKRLTMTPSAISYAVVRGKEMAERNHYDVLSEDTN
jgi:hypothetical protein